MKLAHRSLSGQADSGIKMPQRLSVTNDCFFQSFGNEPFDPESTGAVALHDHVRLTRSTGDNHRLPAAAARLLNQQPRFRINLSGRLRF